MEQLNIENLPDITDGNLAEHAPQIKAMALRYFDDPLVLEHVRTFGEQFHMLALAGGWWTDLATGKPLERNVGEMLCLVHSEVSEAMEGHRKNKQDEHLPHRKSIEVELADAAIRIFDIANGLGLDIIGAMVEKARYNAIRQDHKLENRAKADGKKY